MKVLFFGDLHADSRTPVSRKDDYRKTVINKLKSLYTFCIMEGVEIVVTTGDTFDRTDQALPFLNDLIDTLNLFKKKGIVFYSIVGNHDLPYNSFDYFDNTPLSLLFKTGVLQRLTSSPLTLDENFTLYGMSFTEKVPSTKDSITKYNVLVMHYATDDTVAGESISREDLSDFSIVVAGHDHKYYPVDKTQVPIVVRPGSLTRLTKKVEDVERIIKFYVLDTALKTVEEYKLDGVLPPEDVYKSIALNTGLTYAQSVDYDGIFRDSYFRKEVVNIFDVVNSLPISITEETKREITTYLKEVIPNEEI